MVLHRPHGAHVRHDRRRRTRDVVGWIGGAQHGRLRQRQASGYVARQHVVGTRLVRHDIGYYTALDQFRQDFGGIANQSHREAPSRRLRVGEPYERFVER